MSDPKSCLHCETELVGSFCHDCGQRATESRLRTRTLLRESMEVLTHADSKLWRTLIGLTVRPGAFVREYAAGHRVDRFRPFRYALVVTAVVLVLARWFGADWGAIATADLPGDGPQQQAVKAASEFLGRHQAAVMLAALPVAAAVLRALDWKGRHTLPEYMALFLYALPHSMLLSVPMLFLPPFAGLTWVLQFLIPAAYVLWAVGSFETTSRGWAVLRGLFAYIVFYIAVMVLGGAVVLVHIYVNRPT